MSILAIRRGGVFYKSPTETKPIDYAILEEIRGAQFSKRLALARLPSERIARNLFKQLLCAVRQTHKANLPTLDVSTENLVLMDNGVLKLISRGEKPEIIDHPLWKDMKKAKGYPAVYSAPELLAGDKFYHKDSNTFALGVVLWLIMTQIAPFGVHHSSSKPYLGPTINSHKYS